MSSRRYLCILWLTFSAAAVWAAGANRPARWSMPPLEFRDLARAAGLQGLYWRGSMKNGKIITSEGSGIGWGDYDGDGLPDLFLPQGVSGHGDGFCGRLLRQVAPGRFRDVTERAGVESCGWGMGVLWEDLDGDGWLDLVATAVDHAEIWWNRGDGSFEGGEIDGVSCWTAGAAALDYDRDGDRDLYLSCYLGTTSAEEEERSFLVAKGILDYPPVADFFLRNDGGRRFVEVSQQAGLREHPPGRGLSVVAADFDRDGWTDLYVANDRDPNQLLRNRGDGGFEEVGLLAGVATGHEGGAQAGMGVAAGDFDGNLEIDLVVTNFSGEPVNLYLNQGDLVFVDGSRSWGLDVPTRPLLSWSAEMADFDNDGSLDLFVSNAHLVPQWVSRVMSWVGQQQLVSDYFLGPYRQPALFFRQEEDRLLPVGEIPELVVRGGSTADFDRDGRLDLFLYSSARSTPSVLLRNESDPSFHWLGLERPSAPAGGWFSGEEVEILAGEGERWLQQAASGGSYLSGSSRPLHQGLGEVTKISVEWRDPSGQRRRFEGLATDRYLVLAP